MSMLVLQESISAKKQVFNIIYPQNRYDSADFLYSVAISRSFFAMYFTNKNGIASDNIDVFPANAYSFPSAADTPIFRSAENNEGNNSAAA